MATLSNESGALFIVCVAAINREALSADSPAPRCTWSCTWSATATSTNKCLWCEAMPVSQRPPASDHITTRREPVGLRGPEGSWAAAESSAAVLHQGLARATGPPLPETAQAALKTRSFILMHGFTYSCILNRSTNGHNWIHYWVIRALSHCLCSLARCWGNAQEEQTGQRHGQWQGL